MELKFIRMTKNYIIWRESVKIDIMISKFIVIKGISLFDGILLNTPNLPNVFLTLKLAFTLIFIFV